jgi:SAM-dependent methyltransferase
MKERIRQVLGRVARNSHALSAVDYALYQLDRARQYRSNRDFLGRHPDFAVPPASLAFDAFGHTNYEAYLRSGVEQARFVVDAMREFVPDPRPRVLEWGCGPGRIIRHLPGLLQGRATVVGVDLSAATIEWCRSNIPGISFDRNTLRPPLSYPDRHFQFIYAISVFTHLDEAGWSEWMLELRRLMTDRGVLLFTTHGNQYEPKLLPDERELFKSGRPVFRAKVELGKKRFVGFHPPGYVRTSLPHGLRVLSHTDSVRVHSFRQDVWVLSRVDSGAEEQALR